VKLFVKWMSIEIDSEEHALEVVDEIEKVLRDQSSFYKWDWELEKGE
jgi:hypothetical protein